MSLLAAKLRDAEVLKRESETAELRKGQVGSGDRSEKIRTYDFPQNRITDHRINLSLYQLDRIIAGKYTKTLNLQDLADHVLEDLDVDFRSKLAL